MELSIIIVNFNTKKLLKLCLSSIYNETKTTEYEIIVVDNGSNDGSLEMLSKYYPQVKIVKNSENVGFGKANNQGAAKAKGQWLLLLNSDTQVTDRAIDKLTDIVKTRKNKNIVIGCQLLNRDNSVQPSAGYFPTLPRVIAQLLFVDDLPFIKRFIKPYQQNQPAFYTNQQEVDWVTGACLLVSKQLYDLVGGFDDDIFMYGEEVDLCFRLKQHHAQVLFVPAASVYHFKGGSSEDGFKAAVLGEYKGLHTFYKKHYKHQQKGLSLVLMIGALLRCGLFGIIDSRKARVYYQALHLA